MHVFIAIPAYDGKLTCACAEALLENTHILRDSGHQITPFFLPGGVYIDQTRNRCVKKFMESDCTDLIFLDADVAEDSDAMLKIIKNDKDIVAGVYPFKSELGGFPAVVKFDPVTRNCKEEETGLVTAEMVPTGLMRIKRCVFDRMKEYYAMAPDHEGVYPFFDTGMRFMPDDNTWYGEDVYFCKRWVDMGGEIFIEPRINFTHTGTKHWTGNFHDYLMGRAVKSFILGENKDGIPGWTTIRELQTLSELAASSGSVIEVGSWKGRSTKAMLDACNGTVTAVDTWKGSDGDVTGLAAGVQDVFAEFKKNVGHYQNLRICKGASTEIALFAPDADMVFIDASHSYEDCKADIEAWLPKCRKIMCGHDYAPEFPGVIRAVTEKFGTVNVIDSLWWVEV